MTVVYGVYEGSEYEHGPEDAVFFFSQEAAESYIARLEEIDDSGGGYKIFEKPVFIDPRTVPLDLALPSFIDPVGDL